MEGFFGNAFIDIGLNTYMIAIGDYRVDSYREEDAAFVWAFFTMASLILKIFFMNLLIAQAGESFEVVSENLQTANLWSKIDIIAGNLDSISDSGDNKDYLIVVERVDAEEDGELESQIARLDASSKEIMATLASIHENGMEVKKAHAALRDEFRLEQKALTSKLKTEHQELRDSMEKMKEEQQKAFQEIRELITGKSSARVQRDTSI